MIDKEESVQLAEYSFHVCETLDTVVQGKNVEGLDEPVRMALEYSKKCVDLPWPYPLTTPNNDSRIMRGIERTLRKEVNTPHAKYNEKVEGHMLEIQRILATLDALGSSLNENLGIGKRGSRLAPANTHDTATPSVFENGTSLTRPPSLALYRMLIGLRFSFLNFNTAACGRLTRREFSPHELPALIEAILSSKDKGDIIQCISGDDAQTFVDVIDEARSTFTHHHKSVDWS